MYIRHFIIVFVSAAFFAGCAGSATPPPERQPRDLHRSIRHLNKGTRLYNKGCHAKAVYQFQKAHEMFAAADNLQGAADSLNSLANVYYRLNDMPSAVLVYDEAIDYYRLVEDQVGKVRALSNKSVALTASGKFEAAASVLDQADAAAKKGRLLSGQRLKARAILKLKIQDVEQAKKLLAKAIRSIPREEAGQYASAQYTMGRLMLADQKPEGAIAYFKRALEADQKTESYFGIAQDLESLGDCHVELEQHAQAVTSYKRSIKIYALLNYFEKVEQLSDQLTKSALKADVDIKATMHWVKQWSAGPWEIGICR